MSIFQGGSTTPFKVDSRSDSSLIGEMINIVLLSDYAKKQAWNILPKEVNQDDGLSDFRFGSLSPFNCAIGS